MSLTSTLLIGRSALTTSQLGIQVAGDNLANAATPGYHRRIARISPVAGFIDGAGLYRGLGVQVDVIQRQIDAAVESRLRDAVAQRVSADVPVGALLSGGIDSAAVVAIMREVTPGTLNRVGWCGGIFRTG